MRTTLAIDDDLLAAAKALAERDHKSMGEVVSDLLRDSLRRKAPPLVVRNGIPMLPHRGVVVTPELVNELRDDEE